MGSSEGNDVLELFHPATRAWFASAFAAPTAAQRAVGTIVAWQVRELR